MKKHNLKIAVTILLLSVMATFLIQGCRVKTYAHPAQTAPKVKVVYIDTTKPKKPERLIDLNHFTKSDFDKMVSPEFDRINQALQQQSQTIKYQSQSLNKLSDVLTNMRERAIRRTDSMNKVHADDESRFVSAQEENKRLQQYYADFQKKQIARNAQQIDDLKAIINWLISVVGVIFIIVVIFGTLVWYLYKKSRAFLKVMNDMRRPQITG